MPEKYRPPISELKRAIRAGDAGGLSRAESYETIRNLDTDPSDLANPDAIKVVDTLCQGLPTDDHRQRILLRQGSELHPLGRRSEADERSLSDLTPREINFLRLERGALEESFYRGDFMKLKSEDAGLLAFIANRLAKIVTMSARDPSQKPGEPARLTDFDQPRFRSFLDQVTAYGDQVFDSPEFVAAKAANEKTRADTRQTWEAAKKEGNANAQARYRKFETPQKIRLQDQISA